MGRTFRNLVGIIAALCLMLIHSSPTAAMDGDQSDWVVLFRADNSLLWNRDAGDASMENGFAIRLANAPAKVRYLRLKRMDSGDTVIATVNRDQLGRTVDLDSDFIWAGGAIP